MGGNVRYFVNNLSALDGDLMMYDYSSKLMGAAKDGFKANLV